MDIVNQLSDNVNKILGFVESNKILSTVLAMFLVLYAAMAAPKLPKAVAKIFDNTLFKLGYMFLIAYLATKDPSVAIITATALLITIQTLAKRDVADVAVNVVKKNKERFARVEDENIEEEIRRRIVDEESKPSQEEMRMQEEEMRMNGRQEMQEEEMRMQEEEMRMNGRQEMQEEEMKHVSIPLTPSRAEFIDHCSKLADKHYKEAQVAEEKGDNALAEAHLQEVAKQELKINAVI
jgi:TolA-binding protein